MVEVVTRGYQVRLIIEPDEQAGFLWRDIWLPFAPFPGLCLRLKDISGSGWWDEMEIVAVEWVLPGRRFECECSFFDPEKGPQWLDKFFIGKGWSRL